ncbi:Na+/H+ antiporter NhaC [Winogradskyella sp.]|uniref:Na+/H+ antiporter NhaC n=1 Tax=Winogradskyella sp. TaxID=1883156 RepID=UPI0026187F5B|nr:Na+/H+ antiporter NhaC [Winogradskyella sp.]
MQDGKNISEIKVNEQKIIDNKELSIWEALIPLVVLIILLAYNVLVAFGDYSIEGPNQFALIFAAAVAAIVGFRNKVSYKRMLEEVAENVKSTTSALLILLMVGALAGTWLISGVIPTMIYYGLQILNPTIFLAACVLICAIISIATGSSWTTSATVGIALIGIGGALDISLGMTAGAVLSGAYFGDKMSPLSDTTNLAPAMAGTDLFTHIRYMAYTTVPTILVTLIVFIIIGFTQSTSGNTDTSEITGLISSKFNTSPLIFIVPIVVIILIIKKVKPLVALFIGTLLGGIFAVIFQPDIIKTLSGSEVVDFKSSYQAIINAITLETTLEAPEAYEKLFKAKGMDGMLNTVWLIVCAMVFGGVMDAIGALARVTKSLLKMAKSIFGLFASTVASCLALNITASDQYLAIVVPGKMFKNAYEDRGLAPENLSRTLEDSGTVTSVLIPWNTCGAYQAGVLQVSVADYFFYAIFNWLSPFTTLIFAAFRIKIKQIKGRLA